MSDSSLDAQIAIDQAHIWHPYSAMHDSSPVFHIESAKGVYLQLSDGRKLIDGMSSWWSAIHGYNHPRLNQAIEQQLPKVAHVMFGGLTHEPAIRLAEKLVTVTPSALQSVFFSDSGSVAVEVALKMAIQYWNAKRMPQKQHFATLRNGYHGDTMGAMSVCDPQTGMHRLFSSVLARQFHVERPRCRFDESCSEIDIRPLERLLRQNHDEIAALILEPVVQGAGGMFFYSPEYLIRARELCDRYQLLLIADEIATGFGRSGKLFACEHAAITPDIMCLGKALTGGYMSLAATLTTADVSNTIDQGEQGVFMHGPTFMANPLACAVALASIELLIESDYGHRIAEIERQLVRLLSPCREFYQVSEVRCLGAIGVIEMKQPVPMASIMHQFVEAGIWVRPFGALVYLMPSYTITDNELEQLCNKLVGIVAQQPG